MSSISTTALSEVYSAKFDNLAEVSHPSIFFRPEFGDLLQTAIDRGTPLTRDEVETRFGKLNWEE